MVLFINLWDSSEYEKNGNGLQVEPSSVCPFLACCRTVKENSPFLFETENSSSAGVWWFTCLFLFPPYWLFFFCSSGWEVWPLCRGEANAAGAGWEHGLQAHVGSESSDIITPHKKCSQKPNKSYLSCFIVRFSALKLHCLGGGELVSLKLKEKSKWWFLINEVWKKHQVKPNTNIIALW